MCSSKNRYILGILLILIVDLIGCTPVVTSTQPPTSLPSGESIKSTELSPTSTETTQVTLEPSSSIISNTTPTVEIGSTPETPSLRTLRENCLTILPGIPNDSDLEGLAILVDPSTGYASKYDLDNKELIPISSTANVRAGGYQVSPNRQRLAYFKSNIKESGETIDLSLIVEDADGHILANIPGDPDTWETLYWLDNERLVIGLELEPVVLNPFTGWEFTISDWYSRSPGGTTLVRIPWEVWGVFDSQLSRIFYLRYDETLMLWDLEKERVIIVLDPGIVYVSFEMPKWSPDDTRIAYAFPSHELSQHTGDELFSIDREGQITQLTDLASHFQKVTIWHFDWSPDGQRIAFIFTTEEMIEELAVVDLSTKEITSYCNVSGNTGFMSRPIWSPDGRQLLIERLEKDGATWKTILVDVSLNYAAQLSENLVPEAWMLSNK